MDMDLLPKELIPTVSCYVVCDDYEDEDSAENNYQVDIAICNTSGYLIEIFNKKIVNSCYILLDDATKLKIYYKFLEDSRKVYYLAKNNNGIMIVVRKCEKTLLVTKCYSNIKDFKIFDFKEKGYPQIGLHYFNSNKVDHIEFTEFDNIKLDRNSYFSFYGKDNPINIDIASCISKNDESVMEVDEVLHMEEKEIEEKEEDKNVFKEYLSRKLKGMENYQDELWGELVNLSEMLKKGLKGEFLFPANSFNADALPFKEISIKSTKNWFRIFNSVWILGIEFWRSGIREVDDIKVLVRNKNFSSCSYQFFDASNKTVETTDEPRAATRKKSRTHEFPATPLKSIIVFAIDIPDFGGKSQLSVGFTFIYKKYQYHTKTFHLKPEDLFQEKYEVFRDSNEMSLSEDILACLATSRRIDLIVEMRHDLRISVEDILSKNLGFKKAEILGKSYFIKESGYLTGTLVFFPEHSLNDVKRKLSMYVRDLPKLKLLVEALSNELPLPLRIRIDQNSVTGCEA